MNHVYLEYEFNPEDFADLDIVFNILAEKHMGERVGGYYLEDIRHLTYAFPAKNHAESFINITKRLIKIKIYQDKDYDID